MTIHLRTLTPAPTTLDREARTVEAIVSTGADVQRGGFIERLDLTGADLSRLIGAPVLDGHRSGSTRDPTRAAASSAYAVSVTRPVRSVTRSSSTSWKVTSCPSLVACTSVSR